MFNQRPQRHIEDLPNDEEIYLRYFGEFEIGRHYLSPFRDEGSASFIFYYSDSGNLLWKDFGDITPGGDGVRFVMKKYGLDYWQAINKIYYELEGKEVREQREIKKKKKNIISCTYTELDQNHINHFKEYHINKSTLDLFNVKQVYRLYRNNMMIPKGNLSYVYLFSPNSYKIYQPGSNYKWLSRNIYGVIEGWNQLKPNNIIFVTSSLKDVMVFYELGYPAVAPSNENVILTKDTIEILKSMSDKIYVAHDNDTTGIMASMEMTKMYDLNYFNIPNNLIHNNKVIKDPSDYAKAFGLNALNKLLIKKFKRDVNDNNKLSNTNCWNSDSFNSGNKKN